jgi:2',3'-cyclic-nucleotide 2'-phosphodiesterase (5'-nucleotidase family)
MCKKIAPSLPQVDLFISAHTHEVLDSPVTVEKTGALIVQAGCYAEYVGQVTVRMNMHSRAIDTVFSSLVRMNHDSIIPDTALMHLIARHEKEVAPQARDTVCVCDSLYPRHDLGWIGAEALRRAAATDVGFCHAGEIIRAQLPQGVVDVNAVFRTGGQRAYTNVQFSLPGAEIDAYVSGLAASDYPQTQWAGFRASYRDGHGVVTDLTANRLYTVIMPLKEYREVFVPVTGRHAHATLRSGRMRMDTTDITFTNAVVSYVKEIYQRDTTIASHIDSLKTAWVAEM